jgi:NAD(P)-dependent dehydrogenase (short-subunit alcohol dehydrogenase family)
MNGNKKTILVTGGNRGIGFQICKQLDALGHFVIMGSRNLETGKNAISNLSVNSVVRQVDVNDEESIRELVSYISSTYGKLDVLINNAGINEKYSEGQLSPLSGVKDYVQKKMQTTGSLYKAVVPILRKTGIVKPLNAAQNVPVSLVKQVMETNFYGPFRMIQNLLPLLRKSSDGRIINVSSGSGAMNNLTGSYPAYALSKYMLNGLTVMLSNELGTENIKVYAMCPGWVKTDMGGANAPGRPEDGASTAVWLSIENDIPSGKFYQDRKEIDF